MTHTMLDARAIGVIRRIVDDNTSRGELKQILLEAGADSDRILALNVSGDMQSRNYLSKSEILNRGFDTIYSDFEKAEADGILLSLVRLVFGRKQIDEQLQVELDRALRLCGIALAQVLDPGATTDILQSAMDTTDVSRLNEAHSLVKKALMRISTDPTGAITAAVSAAESVCREALSRLSIPEPSKKQLPDYLVELRRLSNINDLARVPNIGDRAIKSLSSLAENAYHAAHETGDRHAHGDSVPHPSPFVVTMLVTSACAITSVIAGALQRNELTLKANED